MRRTFQRVATMAKLKDIARVTGFSISTVSKALRGSGEVNAGTRRTVAHAAKALGYEAARRRRSRARPATEGALGVLCPEVRSGYYAEVLGHLEAATYERGFSLLLGLTNFDHRRETEVLRRFAREGIQGLICITTSELYEDLRLFREKQDIPIVLLSMISGADDFDYVEVNGPVGVRMAVDHLLELGHQRIGYVGDDKAWRRRDVFVETLKDRGVWLDRGHVRTGSERFERSGYLRMREILESESLPTAVLASYDDVAIGAIRALDEAGLSVPGDMSIVGIDGIEVGAYLSTPLTTIRSPTREMAEAAIGIVFRKIEDRTFSVVQHLQLNPELVVRATTAFPSSVAVQTHPQE